MRPDRIVVGEVRGEEALDMIQSMNTGHDGSLSTGHANSPRDMLSRLETMILMAMELPLSAIRRQIASAVDILIHLGRIVVVSDILGFRSDCHSHHHYCCQYPFHIFLCFFVVNNPVFLIASTCRKHRL